MCAHTHGYTVLHLSCIKYKLLQELQDKEAQSLNMSPGNLVTFESGLQDLLCIC